MTESDRSLDADNAIIAFKNGELNRAYIERRLKTGELTEAFLEAQLKTIKADNHMYRTTLYLLDNPKEAPVTGGV